MKIIFPKTFFASALALSGLVLADDSDVENSVEVVCLNFEDPSICIGEKTTVEPKRDYDCPDLPDTSTCGYTTRSGNYKWEFVFVDGLSEGEGNLPVIEAAKTGLVVKVEVEEDLTTCTISIGDGQTCNSCEVASVMDIPTSLSFDCLNLPDGRETVSILEPFLYPFIVDTTAVVASGPSTSSSAASRMALGSLVLPFLAGFQGLLV